MLKRIVTSFIYDLILIIVGVGLAFATYKTKSMESSSFQSNMTWFLFGITQLLFFVLALISFIIYNKNVPGRVIDKIVELVLVGFVMIFMVVCSTMYPLLEKLPYIGSYVVLYGEFLPQSYYLLGLAECIARIIRKKKPKPEAK